MMRLISSVNYGYSFMRQASSVQTSSSGHKNAEMESMRYSNKKIRSLSRISHSFVRGLRLVSFAAALSLRVYSQALPTAAKAGDLQVGANFNLTQSDYSTSNFKGFGFYTTFDFARHFGIDGEFHQANGANDMYERTFEIGPRYVMHFGLFSPYAKILIGRAVFNFPPTPAAPASGPAANLAFNMWSGGFGTDYKIRPSINLRVDYELQRWNSFPPDGLTPRVLSFGVAYHFH
jgi:Outer membrane protein beta-barrel domain